MGLCGAARRAQATEAELKAWAGERIAAYKIPALIVFMDALPNGLTGKMDRKALRERAAAERIGLVCVAATSIE